LTQNIEHAHRIMNNVTINLVQTTVSPGKL